MKRKATTGLMLACLLVFAAVALAQPSATRESRLPAGAIAHRDLACVANGHERQKLDLFLQMDAHRLPNSMGWFKVYVPENLGKAYIGDTIANDAESVVGRILQATLGEITNDYAKQHIKMSFKIATVTGDAAYTEFVGHEVTRDYLRSLVKRRSSRVDCQVPLLTKTARKCS